MDISNKTKDELKWDFLMMNFSIHNMLEYTKQNHVGYDDYVEMLDDSFEKLYKTLHMSD